MNKLGRNDPCRCGSGRKYKQCCLKQDEVLDHERFLEQKAERLAAEDAVRREHRNMRENWEAMREQHLEDQKFVDDSNAVIDLVRAGLLDEAEAAAHVLLERYPEMYDGYDRLGMVEEARGNPKAAADWYRKCLESIRENLEGYDPELPERYVQFIARLDPTPA